MQNRKQHFDALAPKRMRYVHRHRYYYKDLNRFLAYIIPKAANVIELGCGIGNVIGSLSNENKTGIDFSERMIDEANNHDQSSTRYFVDDIEDLHHAESYEYVLLLDTINSLQDVQRSLSGIRVKLCHDRTRLVLTYHNYLWEPLLLLAEALRLKTPMPRQSWFSRGDVHVLLQIANFEVVTEGGRLLFPYFFPVVSWLCNAVIAQLPFIRRLCLVHYVIARPRPYERKEQSVSIVIPARNESGNIERTLTSIPRIGTSQEIIFVEGGSTDETWQSIQHVANLYKDQWHIHAIQQSGDGKGDAVRVGCAKATNDILMILDADLTVDPSELPKFYEAISMGTGEFINGSRLVYPMEKLSMRFLNLFANKFFGVLFTWILGQRIKDTLCGTKVFRRSDYERIAANRSFFGDFDPFGDFDLLFGASKLNLKIIDVPVRYRERQYGSTNISRFRHGFLLLRMCVFSARKMKFY
jgi:hypothetical protein